MKKKTCELCGCEVESGTMGKHYIVPSEVSEKLSEHKSRVIRLCFNCQRELNGWYSARVADMTYDTKTKQFRAKSPQEMAIEYEIAYQWFSRYKKEQQRNPRTT